MTVHDFSDSLHFFARLKFVSTKWTSFLGGSLADGFKLFVNKRVCVLENQLCGRALIKQVWSPVSIPEINRVGEKTTFLLLYVKMFARGESAGL